MARLRSRVGVRTGGTRGSACHTHCGRWEKEAVGTSEATPLLCANWLLMQAKMSCHPAACGLIITSYPSIIYSERLAPVAISLAGMWVGVGRSALNLSRRCASAEPQVAGKNSMPYLTSPQQPTESPLP